MLLKINNIAKPDSQHAKFLPAIQKTIDDLKRSKVMETFERLTNRVEINTATIGDSKTEWASAKALIETILNPSTPTFELVGALTVEYRLFQDLKVFLPQERQDEWAALANTLEKALQERGSRGNTNLWTPFERALANDAVSGYGPIKKDGRIDYTMEHVPFSIIRNEEFSAHPKLSKIYVNHAETALGREYAVIGTADARYFHVVGTPNRRVSFALSTLGEDSKTLWMPMAVAKEKLADALKRLPIEQAFIECKLEGARLDETMVRADVDRRLNIVNVE